MKRSVLSLTFAFSAFAYLSNAQVVNKSTLYVAPGTTLHVNADMTNDPGATMQNEGTMVVTGNMTNHATYNGAGTVDVGSAKSDAVFHFSGDTVKYLRISATNTTTLGVNFCVSDSLIFNDGSGHLVLDNHVLELGPRVGLRGEGPNNRIVTGNNGKVLLLSYDNTASTNLKNHYLPLSNTTTSTYAPLNIVNSGTADHFIIKAVDPTADGTIGGTAITSNAVNTMWLIRDSLAGNDNVTANVRWIPGQSGSELTGFTGRNAGLSYYDTEWNLAAADTGNLSNTTLINGANYRSASRSLPTANNNQQYALVVGDENSDVFNSGALVFALKVFLQGPYNSSTNEMNTGLNTLIPTAANSTAAYGSAPFNYTGTESFVTVPNNDVVDWVLVEIRDATDVIAATTAAPVARVAGLLLKDGNIVSTDGSSPLSIEGLSITNNAYAIIKHRNHLPVMSALAVSPTNGTYTYDFSTGNSRAYTNSNHGLVSTGTRFSMYRGNTTGDRFVNIIDALQTKIQSGVIKTNVYLKYDINMDGIVNIIDALQAKVQSSVIKSSSVQ